MIMDRKTSRWVGTWWNWALRTGEPPDRRTLAKLLQAFVQVYGATLGARMVSFSNRDLYPERPMIRIGGETPEEPVLWLLGWRQGDETPIHDHERSEVAIRVLRGSIEERVWWPEAEVFQARTTKARRVIRELHADSLVTVPTPYIHRVGNPAPALGVSLHAYYPTLARMRYFEEQVQADGPCLRETGSWQEEGHEATCDCKHEPDTCGDRGCHQGQEACA